MKAESIELCGDVLTPEQVSKIASGLAVSLCAQGLKRMSASRAIVDKAISNRTPVYGVTTGLGPRVTDEMPEDSVDSFSLNTIRGRAHAVGTPLDRQWVRAGLAVRINTLLLGVSGARPELAQHLTRCLNADLIPAIPETGTIGVADLGWGGALGLAMIGEGQMLSVNGTCINSMEAMDEIGIPVFDPGPRDGLALVSNSTMTGGLAALGWTEAYRCWEAAQTSAALSMEGFRANLSPLDVRVLAVRKQPGQESAASGLRERLQGSVLCGKGKARRLQDPLSIRNVAQVHGSVLAILEFTREAVVAEINGASDNPAVLLESSEILSHGGYLPSHLRNTMEALSQSFVHLTALQISRISKLLFQRFTDLPNGLSPAGAEGAGYSPIMKTAEAIFAEIAHLAAPAPIYPGISADGLEDVVTHTAIPVKSLFEIAKRSRQLSAIEAMVATQAIELRELGEDALAPALLPVINSVRSVSAAVEVDRALGGEIELLAAEIAKGVFDPSIGPGR